MRLVVLADTHIPDRYENLPHPLIKEIKIADLIVHAGDFTSLEYFKELKTLKPLKAALGNLDVPELREHLKEKEVFTIQKFKVGLMHGFGRAENVFANVRKCFDDTFHLVIFGHSHAPFMEKIGKTIYFNPGSPTDKIFSPYNSYGIIDISTSIDAKIVRL